MVPSFIPGWNALFLLDLWFRNPKWWGCLDSPGPRYPSEPDQEHAVPSLWTLLLIMFPQVSWGRKPGEEEKQSASPLYVECPDWSPTAVSWHALTPCHLSLHSSKQIPTLRHTWKLLSPVGTAHLFAGLNGSITVIRGKAVHLLWKFLGSLTRSLAAYSFVRL